jgi:hypothetical protein
MTVLSDVGAAPGKQLVDAAHGSIAVSRPALAAF